MLQHFVVIICQISVKQRPIRHCVDGGVRQEKAKNIMHPDETKQLGYSVRVNFDIWWAAHILSIETWK